MAVMERERWTDERLDKAFDRIDLDLRELRLEMRKGFERIDKRFEAIDNKFDGKVNSLQAEMNARFDSLQRMMFIGFVTLFASIVASVLGAMFAA